MGLLNEFFLAVDDEDARRALPDGPSAGGFAEVVMSGGFTNLEVERIHEAVLGTQLAPEPMGVLTEDGDPEGPWVIRFPEAVTHALLEVGGDEHDAVAARWAGFSELQGSEPADLAGLLLDLVDLAAVGVSSGRAPYLWICM